MSNKPLTPKLVLLAVGIVAASLGALLAQKILQNRTATSTLPTLLTGTLLQPPKSIPDFSLLDHTNTPFTAARLHERWTLMFFGFTNCADVCPTTLALLATTVRKLSDLPAAQQPQVFFVSVDAKRDSPEVLSAYVKHFDPSFVGVTGTQTNLDAFTKTLGVPSAIRFFENGSYAVDHYAGVIALNPQGELRALFSAPLAADSLASDYRSLVGAQR